MAGRGACWAALVALSLAACDDPKPRPTPPPGGPPSAQPKPPAKGASVGMPQLPQAAGVAIDFINAAQDPLATPATITAGPVEMAGFAYDPATMGAGRAVDVVIDGVAYPAQYGGPRPDVAAMLKAPGLAACGFVLRLPAGIVAAGDHTVAVRVITADGTGYRQSAPIAFTAR
ncbi:MAG: hypothetical protein JWO33_2476 [Caulobacteraceae bacterium]|nr:hypothetical protein [Caulobacteraceae bacterium]